MKPIELEKTRRHFFRDCGVGVGKMALASLFGEWIGSAAVKKPHFPPKAKSVIYLFMAGGPSQLELLEYKPALQQWDGKPTPDSFFQGKRFAFMDTFAKEVPKLLGTRRKFERHGKSGIWISECLPHIGSVADDIVILSGVATENFNHAPAKIFVNTGSTRFGRPSMGAWITYGLGSE